MIVMVKSAIKLQATYGDPPRVFKARDFKNIRT